MTVMAMLEASLYFDVRMCLQRISTPGVETPAAGAGNPAQIPKKAAAENMPGDEAVEAENDAGFPLDMSA
jgi:hypothetical protein